MRQIHRLIQKMLAPIATRVANVVARAVVKNVDASTRMQLLQLAILDGEVRELEHVEPYGFTSNPRTGAEAVALFVGGRREHGLAIVVGDRRYRIQNLASGEVAMGWDGGPQIICKANGDVEVTATGNVVLNGGSTDVAKVGSSLSGFAGPYAISGQVASGSSTVKVP